MDIVKKKTEYKAFLVKDREERNDFPIENPEIRFDSANFRLLFHILYYIISFTTLLQNNKHIHRIVKSILNLISVYYCATLFQIARLA